ncbi:uncharacterized protein LOC117647715 [Thrips palmi]|uniref:Uncharacterized protein LOC117647715 n=1 Tax=Thrips palmi TaxID=161013 RepID=A0A6P8YZA1_THRPL|nr:uncharacterized protein LOC117647715 [Thrips palmi]
MEMEEYIQEWRQYLRDPTAPAGHRFRAFVLNVAAARVSLILAWTVNVICAVNTLCAQSMREALVFVRILVGTVSGVGAMLATHRKYLLVDACRRMEHVAAGIERTAGRLPVIRENARKSVQRGRAEVNFFTVYGSCVIVGTMYTMFSETERWAEVACRWLPVDPAQCAKMTGPAQRVTSVMMMCGAPAIVTSLLGFILPVLLVIHRCLAHLQTQINYLTEVGPCSVELARLHSDLLKAAISVNRLLEPLVAFYLLGAFVLPLLSTVDVVLNGKDADQYALVIAPVVLIVFVPICEAGDKMLAAHEALAGCAYRGPWLDEQRFEVRLRLNLMLASRMRGALFRGRGIGVLDRGACRAAIRGWFSFLQALINLRQGRHM